jgi:hypothetical protein
VLAVVALIAEYLKVGSITAGIISRLLLVLIILDLFIIFYYLRYLINMISSPVKMYNTFAKGKLKKIRKKTKKRQEEGIFDEIKDLVKISKDTGMGEEKSAALKIFEELLTEVTRSYPRGAVNIPTPTASQYEWWKLLVENIYEMCYSDDHLYSANDRNLLEAIDILDKAWQLLSINHWSKTGFDYAACTKALKKLADWGIKKDYYRSVNRAVAVLKKIWEQCLAEQRLSDQPAHRTSPLEIAPYVAGIGISAVKEGKDDIAYQFIRYLFYFYETSQKKEYLFYNLKLMSFIWDNNSDALEDLGYKLSNINKSEIDEAVKYGSICFQRENVRIRRFLDAWDEFKKKDG